MMADLEIIWTALPNGVTYRNGKKCLKLSIFISPRLKPTGKGKLGDFEDFKNWTRKVKGMNFSIQFGSTKLKAEKSDPSIMDETMWGNLFPENTYVKPHEFDDYKEQLIISYPVRKLASTIQEIYQKVGVKFRGHLPSYDELRSCRWWLAIPDSCVHWNDDQAKTVRDKLYANFFPSLQPPLGVTVDGEPNAFQRLMLFHHRPQDVQRINLPNGDDFNKILDFHQIVSSLGDYPGILRKLGLVIDITVDVDPDQVPHTTDGMLKVNANWGSFQAKIHITPSIHYIWDGSHFETASKSTSSIEHGLLKLDPNSYGLIAIDVDGAALKLVQTALSMTMLRYPYPANMSSQPSLSTIRSGGISLVHDDRAKVANQKFKDASENDGYIKTPDSMKIYAEDTIQGYRIDIWDSLSGQWHSLCKRIGEYRFEGSKLDPLIIADEGVVQMSMTQAATPPNSEPSKENDLYLPESIFRWEGWSLVAPRPGKSISADPNAPPAKANNDPITQFKLKTSFKAAPGSLPRLRFGSRYKLRARVVDLAGNSINLEDVPPSFDLFLPTDPLGLKYLRYDPVLAPVMVQRSPLEADSAPGESLERLVIRTYNSNPSLDMTPAVKPSDRHIAPPRTSQLMAEVHGMFDSTSDGLKPDVNTYNMMVSKDQGTFGVGPNPPVRPEEILKLPYLPDPLARGAAFRNLPATTEGTILRLNEKRVLTSNSLPGVKVRPGSVTMIDFGPASNWPNAQPFRLILEEGSSPPKWDEQKRTLTVLLPKANTATIPFSSFLAEGDLKIMGAWQWIKEFLDDQASKISTPPESPSAVRCIEDLTDIVADLSQLTLEGGFWMLTPSRDINLVHAVQQPLGSPEFKSLFAVRNLGSSFANLIGVIKVNGKSTMKLDITAEWIDPVDLLSEPEPSTRSATVHVLEVPLQTLDGSPLVSGNRSVGKYVPSSDNIVFCLEGPKPSQPPCETRHEFNDTKHRNVYYKAIATSRFREYFPQDKNLDFTRTTPQAMMVDIPSSARPAAPKVLYVIPTFGWKRQTATNLIASERLGGGLRVYLDRPWFSSGEGELLGVVLLPDDTFASLKTEARNALRDRYKHYVTQRGTDPIWISDSVPSLPKIKHFPSRVAEGSNLSLEESAEIKVKVAGHAVGYDSLRKLWYCDIEVETGQSYYPFIRMALARYQPSSIKDAHLSKIVLADYAQIAPDRSIIITYDLYNPDLLNVVVAGITYQALSSPSDINCLIEIGIESQRPDISGELGWMPAVGANIIAEINQASGNLLWKGQALLPSGHASSQKFRLVVKEFERLQIDGTTQLGKRLVFAESIEL
jgi:hypothetical protein